MPYFIDCGHARQSPVNVMHTVTAAAICLVLTAAVTAAAVAQVDNDDARRLLELLRRAGHSAAGNAAAQPAAAEDPDWIQTLASRPLPADRVLLDGRDGSTLLARIALRREQGEAAAADPVSVSLETRLFGSLVHSGRVSLHPVSATDYLGETALAPGDTVIRGGNERWELQLRRTASTRHFVLALSTAPAQSGPVLHAFPVEAYLAARPYRPVWLPPALSISPEVQ